MDMCRECSRPTSETSAVQTSYWEYECLYLRENKEARVVGMERVSGKSVRRGQRVHRGKSCRIFQS